MNIRRIKIGNVELENNVLLAPMAGITDKAFRKMCKKYSNPGLVCTEMISAKGIFYGDEKTKKLLDTSEENGPISIQIFGRDAEIMAKAAFEAEKYADIIDINMGCPAPKVVKNGDGSKLLLDLELVQEIVEKVTKSISKPVTVKLRKGFNNTVAVEAAKVIEKAGASLITIHGRTREEYYSGKVDLDIIKAVKKAVQIPVIGNGDIKTIQDAIKMYEYTNVDGIMVGRAMLGKPWFIQNIIENKDNSPSLEKRLEIIKEHLELSIQEKGEYVGIREMRKHIAWYIKNLKDSSKVRDRINKIETKQEIIDCLSEYFTTV